MPHSSEVPNVGLPFADRLREHIRQNPCWSTLEREQLQEVEKEIEKRKKVQEIRFSPDT